MIYKILTSMQQRNKKLISNIGNVPPAIIDIQVNIAPLRVQNDFCFSFYAGRSSALLLLYLSAAL